MSVKRRERWRQNNPRDQLVGLLMGIEGHYLNMVDRLRKLKPYSTDPKSISQADKLFGETQEIIKQLDPGEWKK